MDVKKELDVQLKKLEGPVSGIRNTLLSFDSIFEEIQEEGRKCLNKKPDSNQTDGPSLLPPSPGNSHRK